MPVAAYYLHDPAAPRPNSPTRMGTNVLLECRGRLLLEQRWDCGAWGLPGGRLRRGESEARGIARELFEETGLRLPEAAFTRVRVVDDADRIASYQDGTVWRMVIVLFRAQLPGAGAALQPGVLHAALFYAGGAAYGGPCADAP